MDPSKKRAAPDEEQSESKRLCRLEERSTRLEVLLTQLVKSLTASKASAPSSVPAPPGQTISGQASLGQPPSDQVLSAQAPSGQAPTAQAFSATVSSDDGSAGPVHSSLACTDSGSGPSPPRLMPSTLDLGSVQPGPPDSQFHSYPQEYLDSDYEEISEEELCSAESHAWCPPAHISRDFSFVPDTKEREPSIPNPDPEILAQGIHCKRLGSSG